MRQEVGGRVTDPASSWIRPTIGVSKKVGHLEVIHLISSGICKTSPSPSETCVIR